MKYLVYIKINDKVYPQLWDIDFSKPIEKRLGEIVSKHQLTEVDQSLSFDELIGKYPNEKYFTDKLSSTFVPIGG